MSLRSLFFLSAPIWCWVSPGSFQFNYYSLHLQYLFVFFKKELKSVIPSQNKAKVSQRKHYLVPNCPGKGMRERPRRVLGSCHIIFWRCIFLFPHFSNTCSSLSVFCGIEEVYFLYISPATFAWGLICKSTCPQRHSASDLN